MLNQQKPAYRIPKKHRGKIKTMKGTSKIGRLAGIDIFIHWTFSLLIIFIIYTSLKKGQNFSETIWSLLFVLAVFATVVMHEFGHALAARRYGIKTKDITLLPIGGLARLEKLPEKPFEELVVAIAGPLVNVALAFITHIFIEFPTDPETLSATVADGINQNNFFLQFFFVNIVLALFNMIPAFPMDGGRVLRALLAFRLERHIATKYAARVGQLLAVGFIFIGIFYNPFLIFIGLFVIMGAQMETEYTESRFFIKGYKVRDVLMKQFISIDVNEPLNTAITSLLDSQSKIFLITENNEPIGTLNRDQIIFSLSKHGENYPIREAMNTNLIFLEVETPLEDIFELVYHNKSNLMLVIENNHIVGTLDTENLLEFLLINEVKSKKENIN